METNIQNTGSGKPKLERRYVAAFAVGLLFVFFFITSKIFPNQYFPPLQSDHEIYLSRDLNVIGKSEITKKAVLIEFNWLILSPWPLVSLRALNVDCQGDFLFCPPQASTTFLLFVVYTGLLTIFILWRSKFKFLLLGLIIVGYGLLGATTLNKYIIEPAKFHDQLMNQLIKLSKSTPFPKGTVANPPFGQGNFRYDPEQTSMSLKFNGVVVATIFYSQSQDPTQNDGICNNMKTQKITSVGNNLYLCEDKDGYNQTTYKVYGFINPERTIFMKVGWDIRSVDRKTAITEASQFFKHYNLQMKENQ